MNRLSPQMAEDLSKLIEDLHNTEIYTEFSKKKIKIMSNDRLKEKALRAKEIRVQLQELADDQRDSDYADSLEGEYEELCENTAVHDYLGAENELGAMVKEILASILRAVELE